MKSAKHYYMLIWAQFWWIDPWTTARAQTTVNWLICTSLAFHTCSFLWEYLYSIQYVCTVTKVIKYFCLQFFFYLGNLWYSLLVYNIVTITLASINLYIFKTKPMRKYFSFRFKLIPTYDKFKLHLIFLKIHCLSVRNAARVTRFII